MAKKKSSSSSKNLLGLLAFVAIIVKAISYYLGLFELNFLGTLTLVADIILTGTALLVAWSYAKTCGKSWRILYFVILILVLAGYVLGGVIGLKL